MMNRRRFLEKLGKAGLGVGMASLTPSVWALEESFWKEKGLARITLLHTNDMHSHITPFPANDPKYPNQGGMAMRAALIKKIRGEGYPVALLDCGDIFQGTPYFNIYGGEPEFKMMSEMGYDVATFGNHDFDNGIEGLWKMMPHAQFSFVNANYAVLDAGLRKGFSPSKILKKGDIKLGVIGLGVDFEGLVSDKNHEGLAYTDPVTAMNREALFLKKEAKCDMVVVLSHLGYKYKEKRISDLGLAVESKNVDVILGGHTHTFLDEPTVLSNAEGKKVVVNQVGWAGLRLGRIDCFFARNGEMETAFGGIIEVSEKTI
jgi:5'-nucleotidase